MCGWWSLENVKKVVTIGQDLRYRRYVYVQRVGDNMRIMIGVCSSGLIVFHHSVRLLSISWPRIVTLRCLRSHFNVKLRRLPDQVFTAHVACAFYTFVFTARRVCIARTMQWQDVCLSVCLTVCPQQMGWQYSDGDSLNGGVECKGYEKITIFNQYLALSRKWCKIEP